MPFLFGSHSGGATTTGSNNSFFGSGAGQYNSTGNENSFFGFLVGGTANFGLLIYLAA